VGLNGNLGNIFRIISCNLGNINVPVRARGLKVALMFIKSSVIIKKIAPLTANIFHLNMMPNKRTLTKGYELITLGKLLHSGVE